MKRLAFYTIATFVIFSAIQSCKHSPPEIKPEPEDTTGTDTTHKRPCSPDTVYYARDIQPIFSAFCVGSGCHSGSSPQEGLDLTTYLKAMASSKIKPYNSKGSKVYESIINSDPKDRMPPSGALPKEKMDLIKKWIDQGAKDLWCEDMAGPCDTSVVTYSKTISAVLTNNCTSCHFYGGSGGFDLTSYTGVKTVVNNGKLWNSINHLSGVKYAMPNSTTKLNACNLRQIKIWIDAGAPQN